MSRQTRPKSAPGGDSGPLGAGAVAKDESGVERAGLGTLAWLAAECQAAMARHARVGVPGSKPHLSLLLPPVPYPGRRVRLAGRSGGPLGEFCGFAADWRMVALFDARRVLAWLEQRGLAGKEDRHG